MSTSRLGRYAIGTWASTGRVAAVLLAGCGGGDGTEAQAEPADVVATTAPSETVDDTPATGTAAAPAGARGGGQVTVGDRSWEFVADVQCQIGELDDVGQIAIISGHAADDPEVEISLDIYPPDSYFDVTIDGVTSFARDDDVTTAFDGDRVTGTATVTDGIEPRDATFDLTCG